MLCRRRCLKLGVRQRLLLIGIIFVSVVILLYTKFLRDDVKGSRHSQDYAREAVYEDFPHYPADDLNILDHGKFLKAGVKKSFESDNIRNDFMPQKVFLGHSLLSEKILKQIRSTLIKMSPHFSGSIPDIEDFILDTAEMLQYSEVKSAMSCREVDSITTTDNLDAASGKLVYKGSLYDYDVAIKSPWRDLNEKVRCLQKFKDLERCTAVMNFQVIREVLLHSVLHHQGIIKMLGYCIRGDAIKDFIQSNGVVVVTEMGMPCEPRSLASRPWKIKLEIMRSLGELLIYLDVSPLGSLRMNKITERDFVCQKEKLKLVDLDELRIGEITCKTSQDCLNGGHDYSVQCFSGFCKGLNAKLNMYNVYDVYLTSLLASPPTEVKAEIEKLSKQLARGEWTPQRFLRQIELLAKVQIDDYESIDENRHNDLEHFPHQAPDDVLEETFSYRRVNMSNFPQAYDFNCDNSRVYWGCAFDAHSLKEAQTTCNQIPNCKAFVAFTSFPEVSKLFTIILKNAIDSHPVFQDGVTLFVKNLNSLLGRESNNREDVIHMDKYEKKKKKTRLTVKMDEVRECTANLQRDQKKLRHSAEKRLMTHLGLKGFDEEDWITDVKTSSIISFHPVTNSKTSFLVNFDTDNSEGVEQAVVLTENGSHRSYFADLVVVFMDRLLGLYHVPPSVKIQLSMTSVKPAWEETWFRPFRSLFTKRRLTVVMSVHQPKVLAKQEILLPKQLSYVDEVVSLSKKQRLQMEYLILMWLTRMPEPTTGHIGYKGHLIQYESSRAFQIISQRSVQSYFYNCQFPKSVVQILGCYRCSSEKENRICFLGHEVLSSILDSGLSSETIEIANQGTRELETIMNEAASGLLTIIDKCVKLFGKSAVFY